MLVRINLVLASIFFCVAIFVTGVGVTHAGGGSACTKNGNGCDNQGCSKAKPCGMDDKGYCCCRADENTRCPL
jgi:hypothetical protein